MTFEISPPFKIVENLDKNRKKPNKSVNCLHLLSDILYKNGKGRYTDMLKQDLTPSETEWMIMEVLWSGSVPMTSSEIIKKLESVKKMSPKTVRVLINRLYQKGIIDYTVDKRDTRVYHYFAVKSKKKCLQEKSRKFAESYFSGNKANALAALIQNCDLTEEQIEELETILQKGKGSESQ